MGVGAGLPATPLRVQASSWPGSCGALAFVRTLFAISCAAFKRSCSTSEYLQPRADHCGDTPEAATTFWLQPAIQLAIRGPSAATCTRGARR